MRDYIYYAGKTLSDFNTFITDAGIYSSPDRGYESIEVPGRNGNLLFEDDKFGNVEHAYPMIILDDFNRNYAALKAFLLSKRGYNELYDTFYPDEFYLATFKKIENLKQQYLHGTVGSCVLVFERKPQRFLKSGWKEYEYTASGSINNPTEFDALPLLRVYGSGTVTVNGTPIVISTTQTYLDIDCELQEVLQSGGNLDITLTNGVFPKLKSGDNTITKGSGITKIIVTPRWWTL